jgi:hypothetical protein
VPFLRHWRGSGILGSGRSRAASAPRGPLSLERATRYVVGHWDIGRVSANNTDRIRRLSQRLGHHQVAHGDRVFFWPVGTHPSSYTAFRVARDDDSRRDAVDLPPEEIANAAASVLRQQISLPVPDLVRETARLFGFQRTGSQVEQFVNAGIDLLAQRGEAQLEAGRATWKG